MSRGVSRKRRRQEPRRPSILFLAALAIGLLLLLWGAVRIVTTPVQLPAPTTQTPKKAG